MLNKHQLHSTLLAGVTVIIKASVESHPPKKRQRLLVQRTLEADPFTRVKIDTKPTIPASSFKLPTVTT